MKIKFIGFVAVLLAMQSCMISKRYHSFGYHIEWKDRSATTSNVEKVATVTRCLKYIPKEVLEATESSSDIVVPAVIVHPSSNGHRHTLCTKLIRSVKKGDIGSSDTISSIKLIKYKKRMIKRWKQSAWIMGAIEVLFGGAELITKNDLSGFGIWTIFILTPVLLFYILLALFSSIVYFVYKFINT